MSLYCQSSLRRFASPSHKEEAESHTLQVLTRGRIAMVFVAASLDGGLACAIET